MVRKQRRELEEYRRHRRLPRWRGDFDGVPRAGHESCDAPREEASGSLRQLFDRIAAMATARELLPGGSRRRHRLDFRRFISTTPTKSDRKPPGIMIQNGDIERRIEAYRRSTRELTVAAKQQSLGSPDVISIEHAIATAPISTAVMMRHGSHSRAMASLRHESGASVKFSGIARLASSKISPDEIAEAKLDSSSLDWALAVDTFSKLLPVMSCPSSS